MNNFLTWGLGLLPTDLGHKHWLNGKKWMELVVRKTPCFTPMFRHQVVPP